MNTALPTLTQLGLDLTTEEAGDGGLDLRFIGTAEIHAIEPLGTYLAAVHAMALLRNTRRVRVDFRRLEFMNSSCFTSFVTWIGSVQDAALSDRYQIEFQSNPQIHWQRRSLNALRCFAMDVVSIKA